MSVIGTGDGQLMFTNLGIGVLLLMLTTAIHAVAMKFARDLVHSHAGRLRQRLRTFPLYNVLGIILLMFIALFLQVYFWALTYLLLGAIEELEQALYFSMVTFTTLGYGDVVLPAKWNLLSSIEGANGIIMFGWTTAIVMAVVQRVYFRDSVPGDSAEE